MLGFTFLTPCADVEFEATPAAGEAGISDPKLHGIDQRIRSCTGVRAAFCVRKDDGAPIGFVCQAATCKDF